MINSGAAFTEKVCQILEICAYGVSDISFAPNTSSVGKSMLGGSLIMAGGTISAIGRQREDVLKKIDAVVNKAMAYRGYSDILRIYPSSPAIITEADEKGFIKMEMKIKIICEGDF